MEKENEFIPKVYKGVVVNSKNGNSNINQIWTESLNGNYNYKNRILSKRQIEHDVKNGYLVLISK